MRHSQAATRTLKQHDELFFIMCDKNMKLENNLADARRQA